MGEFVLDRLNPLLQQLVLDQKAKRDVKTVLTAVKGVIEEGWKSNSLHVQERAACEAAILIALRVASELSIITNYWERDRSSYAAVVHACLGQYKNTDEQTQHGSIKFHHIHPLLSALLSNIGGNSVAVFTVLQAVQDLCTFIISSDTLKKGLLSPQHVALYGKLVSVCLEVVSDSARDHRCRRTSLSTLQLVVHASKDDSASLCVVLPGLSSSLVSNLCEIANEHLGVVTTSLQIFSDAVIYCLGDSVKDVGAAMDNQDIRPELRELLVKRDDEWKASSGVNLTKMIRMLCSSLAAHHDEMVRSAVLEVVAAIRTACRNTFKGALDRILMDLLLTVRAANPSENLIATNLRIENAAAFLLHMHEKLRELAERIPLHVRKGSTGSDVMFHQLAGVLSCLGKDVERLATSRSPSLESVLSALAASIRIDAGRLLISRGQTHGNAIEFLKSLPLRFDVQFSWFLPVCSLLAKHGGAEIVDIAATEMLESSKSDRSSLAILIALILAELESPANSHVLYSLAETCIEWIKEIRPEEHTPDDVLEHKIPVPGEDTIHTIALVALLSVTFTRIQEEKKRMKLLVTFLYELLGLYAITNWIVHDAADCALNQIANAMSLTVSEFLHAHGSYIVHQIALAARSRKEHEHAPVVFSALLDRVDDPQMYDQVRHIVDNLLQALDRFKQTYCILILRSMLAFVTAVGRWFPDLKPPNEDDIQESEEGQLTEEEALTETEKRPPPLPILSVEGVLLRTKHLLSTSHYPIKILLLPMVHQNWEALINRFRDEELEVRIEAVKVVAQMVRVSKTFVYRRVLQQMWPLIEKWMRNASAHTYSSTSAAYKYQLTVLQNIVDIFVGIDAAPEDIQVVLEMLSLYSTKMGSPQLKKAAESSRKRLVEYLKGNEDSSEEQTP